MAQGKSRSKIRTSNRRGARAEAYSRIMEAIDREAASMSADDVKMLLGELVVELTDRLGPESAH